VKRKHWFILAVASIAIPAAAIAAGTSTPYAGQETREIKALSADEIRGYLAGEGEGLAKAAELNHYPGPRHVLDLAKELELTDAQRTQSQALFDGMRAAAAPLGQELVTEERRLNGEFADGTITEAQLATELTALANVEARLRATHLSAHLAERRLLRPAQIARYDQLRGYADGYSGTEHDHTGM